MVSSTRGESVILGAGTADTGLMVSPVPILNKLILGVGLEGCKSLPGEVGSTPKTLRVFRPLIRGRPGKRFFL